MSKKVACGVFLCLSFLAGDEAVSFGQDSPSTFPGVQFGRGKQYDYGGPPAVAVNRWRLAVEVHESENDGTLWYRSGLVSLAGVQWQPAVGSLCPSATCAQYDTGQLPDVALTSDGRVVEVHNSEGGLWYHVGQASGQAVTWGSSVWFDTGTQPAVAVNDAGWVVELHKSENTDTLWYTVGRLNPAGTSIDWTVGEQAQLDSGIEPSIALNNDNLVVEVHQRNIDTFPWTVATLWCRTGVIGSDGTITWSGAATQYDTGVDPDVALTDDGLVIEVHKSQNNDRLWHIVGRADPTGISWFRDGPEGHDSFDSGIKPSVAATEGLAIQVHQTMIGATPNLGPPVTGLRGLHQSDVEQHGYGVMFSVSYLHDRSSWMEAMGASLARRPLWQITLPGSHDAGAYDLSDEDSKCHELPAIIPDQYVTPKARAQSMDFFGQLNGGVRYFDLRPEVTPTGIRAHHEKLGPFIFADIVADLRRFLDGAGRELVVIHLSHFCYLEIGHDFEDVHHRQFLDGLKHETQLGPYLFRGDESTDLLQTTLAEYTASGPSVLLLYGDHDDENYLANHPDDAKCDGVRCVWLPTYFDGPQNCAGPPLASDGGYVLFDDYANDVDFDDMVDDQMSKAEDCARWPGFGGTEKEFLFLLSWTLTFPGDWEWYLVEHHRSMSLLDLSEKPNRELASSVESMPNVPWMQDSRLLNVLFVDFFETARATDVAFRRNGGRPPAPSVNPTLTAVGESLQWEPLPGAEGYDAVVGDLSTLHVSELELAAFRCLSGEDPTTLLDSLGDPAPGEGLWVVARGRNWPATGTFDSGGRGQIRSRDPSLVDGGLCN